MRRSLLSVLAVVCLLVAGAASASVEWPGFRGPNHTGAVPAELFDGSTTKLSVGWRIALGPGYSALAVGDGKVVAMFAEGEGDFVAAYDTESGEQVWRYRIADTYAGHDGSHDGPISTPLIANGHVYGLGAYGHLFAVDFKTGKEVWKTHLVDDHGAAAPHYGFTTSPLIADGVLVVEYSAPDPEVPEGEEPPEVNPNGKAVAGFSPKNGKLLWTAGNDVIQYHSPIVADIGGDQHVLVAAQKNLYGIEPKTGSIVWSYEHGGDGRAMGGMTIVPVPAGRDRVFLMNKQDSSIMLKIEKKSAAEYAISELWSGTNIKASYVTPVYHEGFLYGMNNRIFACVDAQSGDVKWRSREPGDGFPTLVGNHIVMMTKPGIMAVVEATPEAYTEVARIELFDEHSWSEAAFAGGHLFARSMTELARIDLGGGSATTRSASWIDSTSFGQFLIAVDKASDKKATIDAYLEKQDAFPIVEDTGVVTFVYRGLADDVGIIGDMIGFRREDPMIQVEGTDLYYYTTRLEPNAAVAYGFIPNYGDPIADPLNEQAGDGLFGEVSWFAMPAWEAPDFHGEADGARQGRLEEVTWKSEILEMDRVAQVYLPAGYDGDDARYPVVYVHNGKDALENGHMKNALDQLTGNSVEPLIAVFIIPDEENPRSNGGPNYSKMVLEELVPMIDTDFRTIAEPNSRATIGSGNAANGALALAFHNPDVFGRVAGQSAIPFGSAPFGEVEFNAQTKPLVIYLEWGTYHMRSPHEAWDMAEANRNLWQELREAGYRPAGGEVPEGFGWACWNGHTDELLKAMFPMRRTANRASAGGVASTSGGQ